MNDILVKELEEAISALRSEIIEKRKQLITLIDQYQEISGIEIDEELERI